MVKEMKKREFITKNPDEFTVGLVNLIHDYIDVHGLPDALKEETMVEVSHAILSEYEFMVITQGNISMSGHTSSETMYCNGDALVAFLEVSRCNDKIGQDFKINVSPNPYAIVEKKSEDTIPGGKGPTYPNQKKIASKSQRKPGVRKQKNSSDVNQKGARSSVKTSYKRQVQTRDHSD